MLKLAGRVVIAIRDIRHQCRHVIASYDGIMHQQHETI